MPIHNKNMHAHTHIATYTWHHMAIVMLTHPHFSVVSFILSQSQFQFVYFVLLWKKKQEEIPIPQYVNVALLQKKKKNQCNYFSTSIPIRFDSIQFDRQQQQFIIITNELLSKSLTNWFAVEQQQRCWCLMCLHSLMSCVSVPNHMDEPKNQWQIASITYAHHIPMQ